MLPRNPEGNVDPLWIETMGKLVGIAELVKGKLNPKIRSMFGFTHYPPDNVDNKTPWCSAALCSVMAQLKIEHTHSAAAVSWLKWGEECECKPGAIVVFAFKSKHGTGPTDHHVSIVTGFDGDQLLCLGGNQSNTVKRSWYPRADAIGFRWPTE